MNAIPATNEAFELLDDWPWPRWEFVAATPSDHGITVVLAPLPDPERVEFTFDAGEIRVDSAGRTLDSTGYEARFD